MENCLFCRMVRGEITPAIVYENPQVLGFRDINPQAPTHVLLIPREHIATVNDVTPAHAPAVGALFAAAAELAGQLGVAESGYRLVMNCNADAGQTVFHLHLHLLAGRAMGWPPFPAT
jgi:histidine triad (HIT) family protein